MLHHMGGEQDRGPVGRQIADHGFQPLLVHGVQARERLVQDDELRLVHDRGDQLHLLRHPLGQFLHLLFLRGAQPLLLQHGLGATATFRRGQSLQRAEKGDGLDRRHLLVQTPLLGQEADAVAHLTSVGGAQNLDPTRRRRLKPQDHPQGRGLARPIGTQKPADRALLNLKAQIAHRVEIAVSLAHALQRQRRHVAP